MKIIAIDPGYTQSAIVSYAGGAPSTADIMPNDELLEWLRCAGERDPAIPICIEQIQSYGMAVGATVFETVYWSGQFAEAWASRGGAVHRMPRREVKLHLCGQARAKDANIRQALIDKFGPTKQQAIGLKASPGPLYGFKSDMWAALAVAVTWWDRRCAQSQPAP